jgi:hypothetical protein
LFVLSIVGKFVGRCNVIAFWKWNETRLKIMFWCFVTIPQKNANKVRVSIFVTVCEWCEVKWSCMYHFIITWWERKKKENSVIVNVLVWPKTRQGLAVCRAVMMWGEMIIDGQTCICIYTPMYLFFFTIFYINSIFPYFLSYIRENI